MSINMEQFHQVFFEESFEGLDAMESGLLNLDANNSDEINAIFRAAHSIKGGAGTFGFKEVANFTHGLETLLDEMRDGQRDVTKDAVGVLLGSVDCLRGMISQIQSGGKADLAASEIHRQAIADLLSGTPCSVIHRQEPVHVVEPKPKGWNIAFSPRQSLLKTGNDPVRMFRELESLGDLDVTVDLRGVPNLYDLDPEECHLSWKLRLDGDVSREDIDDVFAWVEDECDLAVQADVEMVNTQEEQVVPLPDKIEKPEETKAAPKSSSSIRVDISKIDALINMVGELVITQSMLSLVGENFEAGKVAQLKHGLSQLERHTRALQESVMTIRMLPISFVFSRFPRLAHDIGQKLGKKIELKLVGENTEVDKTVVELLSDPLVHLVRNSLDHGIEMPEERLSDGKPESGTVILEAYHRGGKIVIEVKDDGRGLNQEKILQKAIEKGLVDCNAALSEKQIYELIFMPGFSTAEQVTDISGRGVGMDVVRRNIQSLGGDIDISSELGKGSTFTIHLPLTLAILDGQSVSVGRETYIIPLGAIIESLHVNANDILTVYGKGEVVMLRGQYVPIIRLHDIFNIRNRSAQNIEDGMLVVIQGYDGQVCLFVDELLGQHQVVIKSLETNYRRIEGISAATILGDGSVALILDIQGLMKMANRK